MQQKRSRCLVRVIQQAILEVDLGSDHRAHLDSLNTAMEKAALRRPGHTSCANAPAHAHADPHANMQTHKFTYTETDSDRRTDRQRDTKKHRDRQGDKETK